MSTQPEAILEKELVQQLVGLEYTYVKIRDEEEILSNLKSQLERFNATKFSDKEFTQILNHLSKGNVFERSKILKDHFALTKDDGKVFYVQFFEDKEHAKNLYQVTNQVTIEGVYKNRYDVTVLVNGLPLVQIELKKRGLALKDAFKQISRYKRHSFWVNSGLFQFVQIFVISNGVNTKYYANNPIGTFTFKQTFYWADEKNRNIPDLTSFANAFLNTKHIGKMLSHYVAHNETYKVLMVLRPYQYYAVEALIDKVARTKDNGYIWHTTGSGKTLTSFKASQIIMDLPNVHKVVFVVDRQDLDYQTMKEFNSFKKGSVDVTENTAELTAQFKDVDTKLIVTTIQKLNNAVTKGNYEKQISHLKNERTVFIFDECHRSQFGDTHKRIVKYFKNCQIFGFTGTPIFVENAYGNQLGKRTTKDLFGKSLHKYVITDAIRDENVLRFSVEYVGRYKQNNKTFIDIDVEDIDKREILDSPKRLEKIVDYIIQNHDRKTHNRQYSAIFTVSRIDNLIAYYELFNRKKEAGDHDLRIVTIFSYAANEEDEENQGLLPDNISLAAEAPSDYKSSHSREKLESFIGDYNTMYGTSFSTKNSKKFENYFKDISKRIKNREKADFKEKDRVDILLVVNMFLTGFDAKKINTMYVDKNLKQHGLIQAYSRTNRTLTDKKSQGNIVCFRNLKKATDDAVALFSNKEAMEDIFLPEYQVIVRKFAKAFGALLSIVPTVDSVTDLESEDDELKFVQAFRDLMRIHNVLKTYTEFTWDDLPMNEQSFQDYSSKYLDLRDKTKAENQKEKTSVLEDVDFELELIHRDEINVAYILRLLAQLKDKKGSEKEKQKKQIMDLLSTDVELRSKRELIEKFIEENLPKISDLDTITDEFELFWQDQKTLALQKLCEEENLDSKQFAKLIDAYIFNGQEPLKDEVFDCLEQRPSVLKAREIGERIIKSMMQFVDTFIRGMVA